jgi:hypothetical protein
VIAEDKSQKGVMSLSVALEMARDLGVDLVLIVPDANPPVCRQAQRPFAHPAPTLGPGAGLLSSLVSCLGPDAVLLLRVPAWAEGGTAKHGLLASKCCKWCMSCHCRWGSCSLSALPWRDTAVCELLRLALLELGGVLAWSFAFALPAARWCECKMCMPAHALGARSLLPTGWYCRLIMYSKYKYELDKANKDAKKAQRESR